MGRARWDGRSVPVRAGMTAAIFCGFCLSVAACIAQEPATPPPGQSTPPQPATEPSVPPTVPTPVPAAEPATAPAANALTPIAIIPNDSRDPNSAVEIRGGVDVYAGKAAIESSGTITAGQHSVDVTLPQRGELKLCSTSKVSLTTDSSNPSTDRSGLMMALDHGAMEANFKTGINSDVIMTADFRILISGPGIAAVKVRLGSKGDTCVDNHGPDAPYVTVSSIFDGGAYRVQGGQRVMFEHGSLNEVVDNEKESCGCPEDTPEPSPTNNSFPLAQSAGLAPTPPPRPNATDPGVVGAQATATLSYNGNTPNEGHASVKTAEPVVPPPPAPVKSSKPKKGFFRGIGHFFRNLFVG